MTLFIDRLKEISVFVYVLIFLLVFNLFFNLNYEWYGISLIVRIYIFVFSFYIIFGFASLRIKDLKNVYYQKYGAKGETILFLQARLLPFILIYLVTILFTLIDYIRLPDWPWNPILSLLNGRYSNTIIYSLFLLIILKLRREPRITIPMFLIVFVLYFILDKFLYAEATSGMAICAIKIVKLFIFFLVIFYEFYIRKLITILSSTVLSVVLFIMIFLSFLFSYNYTKPSTYIKKESGLQLLRFGYTSNLDEMKEIVFKTSDFGFFHDMLELAIKYNIDIEYDDSDWKKLLFAAPESTVELISEYIFNKDVELSYNEIVDFVEKRTEDEECKLENAEYFNRIFLKYLSGNEDDLLARMKKSSKGFKIWGMGVLGRYKSIKAIPMLLDFLTDIDFAVSEKAYNALKLITGHDPVMNFNKRRNDPDVIIFFKKYYLQHSSSRRDF